MLKLENVHVNYGNIKALQGISLHVELGEMVTLIGSNGAGKTTCLQTISGLIRPQKGSITYQGEDTLHLASHTIVQRGISQAPEGRHIFFGLTVYENLLMG